MGKLYVLETTRRGARALAGGARAGRIDTRAGDGSAPSAGRRRRAIALLALVVGLGIGAIWAWHALVAPAEGPPAAPVVQVPEHQRSGPLANPWGSGAPVMPSGLETADAPGAAPDSTPVAVASSTGPAPGSAALPLPPTGDAVRQALARLRASGNAAEFVSAAVQGGDAAQLAVAWMAERQCRHSARWRQIAAWRAGAMPNAAPSARGARLAAPCEPMPEAGPLDAAMEAAGYRATADATPEPTRRPIDLALAVSVGDPLLLAEVLEASDGEQVTRQLQAWGADERDLEPEVQRAALWLASCAVRDASGRPSASSALQPACRDHPALWQACMQGGVCDARDLRDMLLRTMPADALGASERLARWLAPRMGR